MAALGNFEAFQFQEGIDEGSARGTFQGVNDSRDAFAQALAQYLALAEAGSLHSLIDQGRQLRFDTNLHDSLLHNDIVMQMSPPAKLCAIEPMGVWSAAESS